MRKLMKTAICPFAINGCIGESSSNLNVIFQFAGNEECSHHWYWELDMVQTSNKWETESAERVREGRRETKPWNLIPLFRRILWKVLCSASYKKKKWWVIPTEGVEKGNIFRIISSHQIIIHPLQEKNSSTSAPHLLSHPSRSSYPKDDLGLSSRSSLKVCKSCSPYCFDTAPFLIFWSEARTRARAHLILDTYAYSLSIRANMSGASFFCSSVYFVTRTSPDATTITSFLFSIFRRLRVRYKFK